MEIVGNFWVDTFPSAKLLKISKLKYPHPWSTYSSILAVDNVYKSLAEKTVGNFYYISGTHGYQQITGGTILQKVILNFVK